jgi:hypothetical protein
MSKPASPTQRTIITPEGTREVVDFKVKQKMFVLQPLTWRERIMALLGYDLYIAANMFYQLNPGKTASDWKVVFTDLDPKQNPKEWGIFQEKLFPIVTETPASAKNIVPIPKP